MKKTLFSFLLLTGMTISTLPAFSQETTDPQTEVPAVYGPMDLWGIGVKAGLGGVGGEVVKGFGERLNLRLGYTTLSVPYSMTQKIEGFELQADAKVRLGGASFLLDYYLVKNAIHVTVGAMQNATRISVGLSSLSGFPYGDLTIPAEEVGRIDAVITMGMPVSPYVGLGFGNTLSRKNRVSFNFELGALYHGGPVLDLSGEGVIAPIAGENNETLINDAIHQYSWFPALSFQLGFRII